MRGLFPHRMDAAPNAFIQRSFGLSAAKWVHDQGGSSPRWRTEVIRHDLELDTGRRLHRSVVGIRRPVQDLPDASIGADPSGHARALTVHVTLAIVRHALQVAHTALRLVTGWWGHLPSVRMPPMTRGG